MWQKSVLHHWSIVILVEVHSDGDKSSCLGDKPSDLCSLFSQSTVMPNNEKEAVNTIEHCDHAEAFVPKSVDNSNVTAVVATQNITVEDKSSSLGVLFVPSVTMTSNRNDIVSTSESGSVFASDIPELLGNSHAVVTMYSEVHSEGEKSSCLDSASL